MRGAFFYGIGIGFASGIFTRSFFEVNGAFVLFLVLVAVAFFVASRLVGESQTHAFLCCIFLAFAGGVFRFHLADTQTSPLVSVVGQEVSVTGRIVLEPEFRETTIHLYVTPNGTDEKVLVTIDRYTDQDFGYGDLITVSGILEEPTAFETDTGKLFDYEGYLRSRGVQVMLPYAQAHLVESDTSSSLALLYRGKMRFMESLESILPEPETGLGEGILLGVKRALGKNLEETFRKTGIIHIVVLSGYNIMIVVSGLMYVLSYFFFPKIRLTVGIIAILLFALLVGPSATVVRASLMAMLLLFAQATGRIYAVLRALFLVGVLMLLHNPYLLVHDPGFQLSFIATLGLILLSPHVEKFLKFIPSRLGIREVAVATLATQIFVLPLLLFHSGLLSAVSLFTNMLVLPMVPFAMILTALTGTFGILLPPLGYVFGFFAHLSLIYIVCIAEFFGSFPLASFTVSSFPGWLMTVCYLALGVVVWRLYRKPNERIPIQTQSDQLDGWTFIEEKETLPFK